MQDTHRTTRAEYSSSDLESKIADALVEHLGPNDWRPEIRDLLTFLYVLDRRWRKT